MSTFADIYGHDKIKEHLQKSIELDKVSHAYILMEDLVPAKRQLQSYLQRHSSVKSMA